VGIGEKSRGLTVMSVCYVASGSMAARGQLCLMKVSRRIVIECFDHVPSNVAELSHIYVTQFFYQLARRPPSGLEGDRFSRGEKIACTGPESGYHDDAQSQG
jgi:hypothetical protein